MYSNPLISLDAYVTARDLAGCLYSGGGVQAGAVPTPGLCDKYQFVRLNIAGPKRYDKILKFRKPCGDLRADG
jgi:hypothetical protein